MPSGAVSMRIEDGGHPGRTALVLERERGQWAQMAGELARGPRTDGAVLSTSEPVEGDRPPSITVDQLGRGFADDARQLRSSAAFIAGRCAGVDGDQLDGWLRGLIAGCDTDDLGASAVAYVEAAMSLVLRGHDDEGVTLLGALVAPAAKDSMADWMAAFYLAQLGDLSGWPTMVDLLTDSDGFTRLMAARHLFAFLPFDGDAVDGETVDVAGRLRSLRKDRDELVAEEIPGLLEEIDAS
jgi:hypothetical protein